MKAKGFKVGDRVRIPDWLVDVTWNHGYIPIHSMVPVEGTVFEVLKPDGLWGFTAIWVDWQGRRSYRDPNRLELVSRAEPIG